MRKLHNAFGPTPEAFDAFVEGRLAALPREQNERPSFRASVIVAAAVMLATGLSLALFGGLRQIDAAPQGQSTPFPQATRAVVEHIDTRPPYAAPAST